MLLSNASKYKIRITPRVHRPAFIMIMGLVLISSIWFWPPATFPFQRPVQSVLTLLLIVQISLQMKHRARAVMEVTLFEDGRWVFHSANALPHVPIEEPLRLTSSSKANSALLWLHIRYAKYPKWFWIFSDEVSDEDYRKLCLAIRYCQQMRV